MMIEILEETSSAELEALRLEALATLDAPMDGMWEAFALGAVPREIRWQGKRAGFFFVDDEGLILQFYVTPAYAQSRRDIFQAVLDRDEVRGAMVSTGDSDFLALCQKHQTSSEDHTLLYGDQHLVSIETPGGFETSLKVVEAGELDAIAKLQRESLDQDLGDWLLGYLANLIARRELHALRRQETVIATGEIRVSDSQKPYGDLGVITMRPHRGQGAAAYLLSQLKQRCHERGLLPICSTTTDNIAAQKAIEKAGFVPRHRMLRVAF